MPGARIYGKTKIGNNCTFGGGILHPRCVVGDNCTFNGATINVNCKFGKNCTFNRSHFDDYCVIGQNSELNWECTLGYNCKIGKDTKWCGDVVLDWLYVTNMLGNGRQTLFVKHPSKIHVATSVQMEIDGCRYGYSGPADEYISLMKKHNYMEYAKYLSAIANILSSI